MASVDTCASAVDPWSSIDAIYIISHPIHEKTRFDKLTQTLAAYAAPPHKIKVAAPTWGSSLPADLCFQVYDPFLPRPIPALVFKSRALLRGEISLVLNFYSAIKDAYESHYRSIMVLESDVIFHREFLPRLASIMEALGQIPVWDYVSLSDGVGTHVGAYGAGGPSYGLWYSEGQTLQPAPKFMTFRCTDSMLLGGRFIEYLYKNLLPFRDCLDWELNYQLYALGGTAFWAEPHIVEQASCKGLMASQL